MSSSAQIAANQANAQYSTGAKTQEGKAISSRNALKTGLTGHTILLPTDDAQLYEEHLLGYADLFEPEGDRETELVQSIADCRWRIARIPGLEAALYARGQIEFAQLYEGHEDRQRAFLIGGETYTKYFKQLHNPQLQEQRLSRRADKEEQILKVMQKERIQERQAKLTLAARQYLAAQKENKPFNPAEFGFEFSLDEIKEYAQSNEFHRANQLIRRVS
jgi:hypothetical protein